MPNNIPLNRWTTFGLPIHQLMNIWFVSSFWLLWIMLWTTYEHATQTRFCRPIFIPSGYTLRSQITGSYGDYAESFKNYQTICKATFLHSHYKLRVPMSPHPDYICYILCCFSVSFVLFFSVSVLIFIIAIQAGYEVLSHSYNINFSDG